MSIENHTSYGARMDTAVLGYRGLLEWIRVGLDPGVHEDDHWFCSGAPA